MDYIFSMFESTMPSVILPSRKLSLPEGLQPYEYSPGYFVSLWLKLHHELLLGVCSVPSPIRMSTSSTQGLFLHLDLPSEPTKVLGMAVGKGKVKVS